MEISNFGDIKVVAFDIDGTLYEEKKLNSRIIFHFLAHLRFFSHYGLARVDLRKRDDYENFTAAQAEMMAKRLHCTPEQAQAKLDKIVYVGLRKYFKRFDCAKGSRELIIRLKEAGVKIALLSDFPPEQKGDIWGLKPYCDLLLGSEEVGALKPSPKAFLVMAERFGVSTSEIFYIGNNHKYDVVGPKKIGMRAGWIISPVKAFLGKKSDVADFTFSKFSQLEQFIFGDNKSECKSDS